MRWCWLALVEDWPESATAAARASDETGEPAGFLAAWCRRGRPTRDARRMDARAVDADGAPARVSIVLPRPGVRLPFDDVAVQEARRRVLAEAPFDAVSTLLTDSSHFEGSITIARGGQLARLGSDPFARVFPQRILDVEAGLFGVVPAPAGPTIERYGSDSPWPLDRFA